MSEKHWDVIKVQRNSKKKKKENVERDGKFTNDGCS